MLSEINLDEPPTPVNEEKDEQQVSDESEAKQDDELQQTEQSEESESPIEIITEEKSEEESVEPTPVVEAPVAEAPAQPELPENLTETHRLYG